MLVLALSGCGGGDSGSPSASLNGAVVDGPVLGATVKAYAVNGDGSVGSQVGLAATTAADGSYALDLQSFGGGTLVVVANGGSYCKGSSTAQVTTNACSTGTLTTLGQPLATVASVTAGATASDAYVSPVSTAAVGAIATLSASTNTVSGKLVKSDFDAMFGAVSGGLKPTAAPAVELQPLLVQINALAAGGATLDTIIAGIQSGTVARLAAAPANGITLSGAVKDGKTVTLTATELKSQVGDTTQTVSFTGGGSPQTHTYTGADLWKLLQTYGADTITTGSTNTKNTHLERYVLATAKDGYQAAYALGELDPSFGGKQSPNQQLVAYAETVNGASTPLDESTGGPLRVTVPGDIAGGRYVSLLRNLDVKVAPATAAATKAGCSGAACVVPSFTVDGQVKTTQTFDVAGLKALVAAGTVAEKTFVQSSSATYKGAYLWDLLSSASVGLKTSSRKNSTISMVAVATGSDGYRAMVSLGEINPGFGNKNVLIAYELNNAVLDTSGAFRLVVPNEVKQGRLVSNLIEVKVFEAGTP